MISPRAPQRAGAGTVIRTADGHTVLVTGQGLTVLGPDSDAPFSTVLNESQRASLRGHLFTRRVPLPTSSEVGAGRVFLVRDSTGLTWVGMRHPTRSDPEDASWTLICTRPDEDRWTRVSPEKVTVLAEYRRPVPDLTGINPITTENDDSITPWLTLVEDEPGEPPIPAVALRNAPGDLYPWMQVDLVDGLLDRLSDDEITLVAPLVLS